MTQADVLNRHAGALDDLLLIGAISSRLCTWLHVWNRYKILLRVNANHPIKQLSEEFGYSRRYIHIILNKMQSEV